MNPRKTQYSKTQERSKQGWTVAQQPKANKAAAIAAKSNITRSPFEGDVKTKYRQQNFNEKKKAAIKNM